MLARFKNLLLGSTHCILELDECYTISVLILSPPEIRFGHQTCRSGRLKLFCPDLKYGCYPYSVGRFQTPFLDIKDEEELIDFVFMNFNL